MAANFSKRSSLINNKKYSPILLINASQEDIDHWLWEVIRPELLNPVILVKDVVPSEFIARNPSFGGGNRVYHRLVPMANGLKDLLEAFSEVGPIPGGQAAEHLYAKYGVANNLGKMWILISHDLKLDQQENDLKVLSHALSLARLIGDNSLPGGIGECIRLVEANSMSEAIKCKEKLENILRDLLRQEKGEIR